MKETKISPINPSKIKVLTIPASLLKLNKCAKNEYAITKGYHVLHVFESRSLSKLFAREGRKKLRWIRLIERSTQHGSGSKRLIELHFQFCDGRKFILDERDRIFAVNEVTSKETPHSPCGLWGLVPNEPIIHMILTGRMVDRVESLAQEDQIEHVLRTYWKDWTLLQRTPLPLNRSMKIRGEFGSFKAKRINSVMVKFDL